MVSVLEDVNIATQNSVEQCRKDYTFEFISCMLNRLFHYQFLFIL